jgi:hypothetical protein
MDDRILILNGTGLNSIENYEKHLGLPALIGRSRISTFNGIKGRIWNRINRWKEKFLSHAEKEVLLKSVIQAIPTYTSPWMSWKGMGKKKLEGGLGYKDSVSFNTALLAK